MSNIPFRILLGAGLLAGISAAHALEIDTFGDDQSVTVVNTSDDNDVAPGGFVGTNRNLAAVNTGGQTQAFINNLTPGALDISNTTTANGTVTVNWTGISGSDSDFTAPNATGVFIGIPNPIDNLLTITMTANGSSSATQNFPNGSVGSDFFFPFASFSDPSVFTAVTSFEMVLSSNGNAWDASIEFVETRDNPIPLPGTLALLGLGLASLGVRRAKLG
jgi:hypothetical protein